MRHPGISDANSHSPGRTEQVYFEAVTIVRARVKDGRLVIEEPTDLPEGAAVELLVLDADDGLDDGERQALRASIDRGLEEAERGEVAQAAEVVRRLRNV